MKSPLLLIVLSFTAFTSIAQIEGDFRFGEISKSESEMSIYPKDSSAEAVVLNEFGKAWIDLDHENRYRVYFYHHKRIKIFSKKALNRATISVVLYKAKNSPDIKEKISDIKGSTFNFSSGERKQFQMDEEHVFTENQVYSDISKFTLPNVSEGSIIEFSYRTESPYLRNFQSWYFQEDIPKVKSEFWSSIPATHIYNASLKGFLKLSKNESSVVNSCLTFGTSKAQCSLSKFAIEDIPAFVEEDFMLSKHNFISCIQYELKQSQGLTDGTVIKHTKEWKDADYDLRMWDTFGGQIKRGRFNFWDEKLSAILVNEKDSLAKAKKVYDFIKNWFTWNNGRGILCEDGIKKAFERRSGDVSEINLSLISALRYAGIEAQPIILSTRDQALPIELYPVITSFNYVIASCKINGKTYYLDATDRLLSFGMLPMHCMNGKGRLINTDFKSEWVEIPNKDKQKNVTMLNLKLDANGAFKGTISKTYFGYDSYSKRKEIKGYNSPEEYSKKIGEKNDQVKITGFKIDNLEKLDTCLVESMEVEIIGHDNAGMDKIPLDPFFSTKWSENPFKARERLFPVDFGMPFEIQTIIQLEVPENYFLPNVPPATGLLLPQMGGKYLCNFNSIGNKIMMNQLLSLNRPVYSSEEYHYLKELFNKVIETESIDLVFEKKKQ
jgi:hypothetical protein